MLPERRAGRKGAVIARRSEPLRASTVLALTGNATVGAAGVSDSSCWWAL